MLSIRPRGTLVDELNEAHRHIAELEGRLALPAWQAEDIFKAIEREIHNHLYTNTKNGHREAMFNIVKRVREKCALPPPPSAEGETRCDLDPLANVNEIGTGNIK